MPYEIQHLSWLLEAEAVSSGGGDLGDTLAILLGLTILFVGSCMGLGWYSRLADRSAGPARKFGRRDEEAGCGCDAWDHVELEHGEEQHSDGPAPELHAFHQAIANYTWWAKAGTFFYFFLILYTTILGSGILSLVAGCGAALASFNFLRWALAMVKWKVRAIEAAEQANNVVPPPDRRRKTEMELVKEFFCNLVTFDWVAINPWASDGIRRHSATGAGHTPSPDAAIEPRADFAKPLSSLSGVP